MPQSPLIHWIAQITQEDQPVVGQKAANLGDMAKLELPVPNGYVVSSQAYFDFLAQTGLQSKISRLLNDVDIHDSASLQKTSSAISKMILQATLPEDIENQIISAYRHLSSKNVLVAVRSSVTLHSNQHANLYDGYKKTFLNVIGQEHLIESVKRVWASIYEPINIFNRTERGQDHSRVGMAVIIQRMIEAEVAGVVFSVNPVTNNRDSATIEAVWGLGETIANGEITPDHYEVKKNDWRIVKKEVVRQEWQLMKTTHKKIEKLEDANLRLPVSIGWQKKQKLSDRTIVDLVKVSQKLEAHFGVAQDTEWAYANHTLYIIQTQPLITIELHDAENKQIKVEAPTIQFGSTNATPLLVGAAASAGRATGPVVVIKSGAEIKNVKSGSVVVASSLNDELSPLLEKSSALVIDEKGLESPVILSAREKGLPVIVGTLNGTRMLRSGEVVTVDGTAGHVFEGSVSIRDDSAKITAQNAHLKYAPSPILGHLQELATAGSHDSQIHTATKVYINLTEPETAELYAKKDVDGVGLLRAEYMIKNLGEHPNHLIKRNKQEVFVDVIYEGVKEVAKAFSPRPVIYRFSDLTSNQYGKLNGGDTFETIENNPDIGYRGAYRYIAEPEAFKLEIQAIKRVRQYYKNVWVMAPFVRTPHELVEIKSLISEEGLYRGGSFKLFMMAEVPSNVLLLDQFIGAGIDGISIGSNDLTQLILGLDRHNPRVAAGFDERQEAVMLAMEQIVTGAARHGIMCSICGQAPSAYPELARQLVEWGITSVSVSAEAAATTRRMIADAEFELVRQGKNVKRKGL